MHNAVYKCSRLWSDVAGGANLTKEMSLIWGGEMRKTTTLPVRLSYSHPLPLRIYTFERVKVRV